MNSLLNPDGCGNVQIKELNIDADGLIVHLKGSGFIKVFKTVSKNRGLEYWATNDLKMSQTSWLKLSRLCWSIEEYYPGLKQFVGIERSQVGSNKAQRNHIGLALRAFLRLERYCFRIGHSWFSAKVAIVWHAVQAYLANPLY